MIRFRPAFAAVLLLAGVMLAAPFAARAAESYDNCSGFIDTVPTTITTQGVWCLRHDLSTAITSGHAITVAANNVTIDCNDFKLGGLAAGIDSAAYGIYASSRLNATVRHCNIRGFYFGIDLEYGAGHRVEDNRLDGNLFFAVKADGDGTVIRDNLILDTGGGTNGYSWATAIDSGGSTDIINNTIAGMVSITSRIDVHAIVSYANDGGTIAGNRIRGLAAVYNLGIRVVSGSRARVIGNSIDSNDWSIYCDAPTVAAAKDNVSSGGGSIYSNCYNAGGNVSIP